MAFKFAKSKLPPAIRKDNMDIKRSIAKKRFLANAQNDKVSWGKQGIEGGSHANRLLSPQNPEGELSFRMDPALREE